MRILIVDDNPAARIMIGEMLRLRGHQIVGEAENLGQAIRLYQSAKPDLVTLDVSMVEEDGGTVLDALRKADGGAKVLMISGISQQKMREQLLAAGAAGFLSKPFSLEELEEAVSRMVPRPAAGAGASPVQRPASSAPLAAASEDAARQRLAGALRAGAERCAGQLAKVSRAAWSAEAVSLGADSDDHFETLLASIRDDHYGACSVSLDGVFLVIFARKIGFLVTDRVTRAYSDRFEVLDQRESAVLAEVSQLLVNALAEPLAAAGDTSLIFSAPETNIGSRRDLMLAALKKFKDPRRLAVTAYLHLLSDPLASDCVVLLFLSRELIERLARRTA